MDPMTAEQAAEFINGLQLVVFVVSALLGAYLADI